MGLSLLLMALVGAATCRPSWYRPLAIDHARLKADKRDFVHLVDAIGVALNSGQTIDFELAEEQVNRWLAARGEVWPASGIEVEGLDYPQVNWLGGNRVRVAATVTGRPIELIVSAIARCELVSGQLVIQLEGARCGVLPVPRGRILDPIRQWLSGHPDDSVAVSAGAVSLRNRWVWENGKRPFRLRDLEISDGAARVSLEPLRAGP
jgi:hypothetical protein